MSSFTVGNVIFTDNTYATLASGLTVGATALSFTAGMGARFPVVTAPYVLYCTLLNATNVLEEIQITAHVAGADTATIARAVGGTTALVWNAGDRIEARVSASVLATITAKNMYCGTQSGGSANALTFVSDTPKTAYRPGDEYLGITTAVNTTAVTVNFDGIGLLTVQRDGTSLNGAELAAGALARFTVTASTSCDVERVNNVPLNIGKGSPLTSYYKNTFTDLGGTYAAGYFFKDPLGFVNMQGSIACVSSSTGNGQIIATLPAGQGLATLSGLQFFNGVSGNSAGSVYVDGTGNIRVNSMPTTAICLDQVRYYGNPTS
jgi:hypothetical protein